MSGAHGATKFLLALWGIGNRAAPSRISQLKLI